MQTTTMPTRTIQHDSVSEIQKGESKKKKENKWKCVDICM